jgi:hypothetical protein
MQKQIILLFFSLKELIYLFFKKKIETMLKFKSNTINYFAQVLLRKKNVKIMDILLSTLLIFLRHDRM